MTGREMRCDLLIVGAGPAGCAAALAARSAAPRLAIVIIDAARFPREKPCGGAITGGGLRELESAGLELRVPHVVVRHAALRAAGGTIRVELPRPAVVVRRLELDADLVAQARRAGTTVLEDTALLAVDGDRAITTAGTIWFGTLVAADGARGPTRRALGLTPGRRVPLREKVVADTRQWDLLFDLDVVAAGYAWRFPCVDRGRAAETCGVYSIQRDAALKQRLARFARDEGLEGGDAAAWAIRLFDPGGPFGSDRALLAGEALGVDPLAGEGIRYALWSGRIAGRMAALAAARGDPVSPSAYRAQLLASRSGLLLQLAVRLSRRLYGRDQRWRRLALDPHVAGAVGALVSGDAALIPLLGLLWRYPWISRARQS